MSHCEGKKRFTSYAFAAKVAKRSRMDGDSSRRHVYHCRACNGFHIGSQIGVHRRKPREEAEA